MLKKYQIILFGINIFVVFLIVSAQYYQSRNNFSVMLSDHHVKNLASEKRSTTRLPLSPDEDTRLESDESRGKTSSSFITHHHNPSNAFKHSKWILHTNCTRPKDSYRGFDLKRILEEWINFANEFHVEYFLTAGTLFGAFLLGDTIDCDPDLDILINEKQMKLLEKYSVRRTRSLSIHDVNLVIQEDWRIPNPTQRRRFRCDGKRSDRYVDECSFIDPVGRLLYMGFHMDIFTFKLQNGMVSNLINDRYTESENVFPLQPCRLFDTITLCPRRIEHFLKLHYGTRIFNLILNKETSRNP